MMAISSAVFLDELTVVINEALYITAKHYFCILFSQFSYVENLLHLNLADFQVAYQPTAVTLMVLGSSKNS